MRIRCVAAGAFVLAGVLSFAGGAQALTMKECSAKYKAAEAAGTLKGQKWNDFRKAECGSDAAATRRSAGRCRPPRPLPSPRPQLPRNRTGAGSGKARRRRQARAEPERRRIPDRGVAEILQGVRRQGAHAHLPRPVRRQQGQQRHRQCRAGNGS